MTRSIPAPPLTHSLTLSLSLSLSCRYGREVTVEDVDRELSELTTTERKLRLIEGVGLDRTDGRLPGPLVMDNIAPLMKRIQ